MPPIIILTGNLLAERTLEFGGWQVGQTQRAARESFQVGGKGFNVAKMLQRLGVPACALGFVGGPAGAECEAWLRAQATYEFRLFPTTTPTRTGVVVRAPDQPETTFLAPDREPDATALRTCAEYLNTLPPAAWVLLCGSFPGWRSDAATPVRTALATIARRGRLVIDTYGPPLADLAAEPVALIKVNRAEFDGLWPQAERSRPVADRLSEAATRWAATAWVVTDGPRPVVYWCAGDRGELCPPPVQEVSATGSGDVLLAALVSKWIPGALSLAPSLAWALPWAARNAAASGVADFPLSE